MTEPFGASSNALWTVMMLSGRHRAVNTGPTTRAPFQTGLIPGSMVFIRSDDRAFRGLEQRLVDGDDALRQAPGREHRPHDARALPDRLDPRIHGIHPIG